MKFVVVSGGVLSGLGKGVTSASIGLLLKSRGLKVTIVKCDMYLNIDAGTMNPLEHGEVFVTHDGLETDQDLGHYERFLNVNHTRVNYMTNGQIYSDVLAKERALAYQGACVQPYHHLPPEIIGRWFEAGKAKCAQVVIIELGGTVGEYEGLLFFESVRRLRLKHPGDVLLVHVGYLPVLDSIGELKSKPIQQSIHELNSLGLMPDIVVARAKKRIDLKRKEKIALASGLSTEDIISNEDVPSIYEIPLLLDKQSLTTKIIQKLGLKGGRRDLKNWREMVKKDKAVKRKKKVKIAIAGKYQKTGDYTLEDAYVCVVEALKHASWRFGVIPELYWYDCEKLEKASEKQFENLLAGMDGLVVPQGWGKRGTEGKIRVARFARENKIPYLGLCFGMQMASIEFARHVVGLKGANSEEVDPKTPHPVIHIIPQQAEYLAKKQYGGTIRLGAWPARIKKGTKLFEAYQKYGEGLSSPWYQPNPGRKDNLKAKKAQLVFERHRHRYEFNNRYKKRLESKGLVIAASSPDGRLVEAIELKNHPFFVGTQFHPEYLSRPLAPHPVFLSFLEAVCGKI